MSVEPGWTWLAAATLLAAAELMAPGVFLIWLAVAAGITGLAVLAFDIPVVAQFGLFAISAVGSIYAGRAVYRHHALPADPLLNDGAARLIGRQVTIVEGIVNGEGRALVGDNPWTAQGEDMPTGTRAIIVDVVGNVLTVVRTSRAS